MIVPRVFRPSGAPSFFCQFPGAECSLRSPLPLATFWPRLRRYNVDFPPNQSIRAATFWQRLRRYNVDSAEPIIRAATF
jgi:hypothetical protein